jgi:hypothetical protein
MFSMGFASQDFFGIQGGGRPSMGDSTTDGDKILSDISAALNKSAAIDQWVKTRPDYQTVLGAYFQTWNNYQAQADNNWDVVTTVQQRLKSDNPEAWFVSRSELDAINNWISAINQQYQIILTYPAIKAPAPVVPGAAAKAPVPAPSSGPSPLVIGAGAIAAVGLLALVTR